MGPPHEYRGTGTGGQGEEGSAAPSESGTQCGRKECRLGNNCDQ